MSALTATKQPLGVIRSEPVVARTVRTFSSSISINPVAVARNATRGMRMQASNSTIVAVAAPADQKIRIKLKSYWVDLLQDSVEKIKEAAASTGATIAGPVPLPTRCV
jgi:acyl-CoA hydrolase